MRVTNTRIPLTILGLAASCGLLLAIHTGQARTAQPLPSRADPQLTHQVRSPRRQRLVPWRARNGTGKIPFPRVTIFEALPLWMPTPAPWWAKMEPLFGRPMAEAAGQFKPVVQQKLCGPFPSRMQITEQLLAKAAPSLEQRTEVIIGSRSQVEQLLSFEEFRSVTQIMERLWVTAEPFLEPLTAETAGSLNQVEPRIHCSVFPSLIPIREQRWAARAESAAKAPLLEQPTEVTHGRRRQTPVGCVF